MCRRMSDAAASSKRNETDLVKSQTALIWLTVTSYGKSNIALRLTPKLCIQDSPALDRISKARGSRQPARWVTNRPLCVPRERANQEAS
jgi:hypothetical protein